MLGGVIGLGSAAGPLRGMNCSDHLGADYCMSKCSILWNHIGGFRYILSYFDVSLFLRGFLRAHKVSKDAYSGWSGYLGLDLGVVRAGVGARVDGGRGGAQVV